LILRGVVGRGQGLAGRDISVGHPLFSAMLGVQLHPGSINLFVSAVGRSDLSCHAHPFFRAEQDETVFVQGVIERGVLPARDCRLNGHVAFLLRTEYPGAAYGGPGQRADTPIPQPNVMFEIVGSQIPGVSYGVAMDLEFDPDPLKVRRLDPRPFIPRRP
jgi:hypothetical protein